MAQWKKVLVSGSSAELSALKVDNLTSGSVVIGGGVSGSLFSKAINGSGDILATSGSNNVSISSGNFSGSFTGSFVGDGSGLTNLSLDGARIATGSVTASVNVSGSDIFQITSGSSTLFTINADGATFAMGVTASQGFYGTASWAVSASYVESAVSSSYPIAVSGSTIYTPFGVGKFDTNNSIFLGVGAGSGSEGSNYSIFLGNNAGYEASNSYDSNFFGGYSGYQATNAYRSNFIGSGAGYQAKFAGNSNFLGISAGDSATNASYSNFLGTQAGYQATNAQYSNFLGNQAGYQAISASNSNFLGNGAGYQAESASNSNFLGNGAGYQAFSASYSTLIGYRAGYNFNNAVSIGSNNIVIGTNITLEKDKKDSINLGAIIFATGSYSTTAGNPFSGSVGGGKVGINVVNPKYTLDVSGSGNFTNGLTITGSLVASSFTGSFLGTASLSGTFNGTFSGSAKLIYTASQGLGISTFKYDGSENVKVEVSGASTLSNDTVVLWKTGSGVFSNSTISENSQGVYINNTQGVVVAQGGIQVSGSSKFHNNLVVQGDLTVQGTASFQNTTNLEVADQFILLSSGSSTFQDSGIIVNGGSNLSGSALFLETNNAGPNGRWGVQADLLANATTATADQYMVTAKIDGAPTGDPAWGGATNGLGNIWINTGSGDIYIYA